MKTFVVLVGLLWTACASPEGGTPVGRTVASPEQAVLVQNLGPGTLVDAHISVSEGTLVAPMGSVTLPASADLGVLVVVRAPRGAVVTVVGQAVTEGGVVPRVLTYAVP